MYRYNRIGKVAVPPFTSTRLLDQARERIRYPHHSHATEKAYTFWPRYFIRWSGLRHPRDMGKPKVEAFLSMMANEQCPFLYSQAGPQRDPVPVPEVLGEELHWLQEIGRPAQSKRIPSVLTKEEIGWVLACMEGEEQLLAKGLYESGMRLTEGLSLRVKYVDFGRRTVIVRDDKGGKDRVVMLPRAIEACLWATPEI